MAMFNWLSKRSSPAEAPAANNLEQAKPNAPPAAAVDRQKQQRHARREQLYMVVRDSMTHAGVLSSGYKFKVLSLDQIGDEFLVMVDLAQDIGTEFDRLSVTEAVVIANAQSQFQIKVPAVYWRRTDLSVFSPPETDNSGITKSLDLPAAHRARPRARVPSLPVQAESAKRHGITDDEVAAFNRALLAASSTSQPGAMENTVKLGNKPPVPRTLPDFADTEMADSAPAQALGKTQYGELR